MRLSDVVRRFGVEPEDVRRMAARANVHWRVSARGERFVLRRYAAHNADRASIEWENRVVRHLAARGWPVAAAIGDPVEVDGHVYVMFPHIGGPRRPVRPDAWRRCGRILAGLHEDLSTLELGQRPGWKDSFETARTSDRRGPLIDRLSHVDAGLARTAARMAEEAEAALADLSATPRMVIHGDLAPWNVRFQGDDLTAVYDFELAHLDARASDVAWARRGYHDDAVEGYLEAAALSDRELGALHHLWIVWVLNLVWNQVERGRAGEPMDWCVEQIAKTRPYRRDRPMPSGA